jgi:hypothetical protein
MTTSLPGYVKYVPFPAFRRIDFEKTGPDRPKKK